MDWLKDFKEESECRRQEEAERERRKAELERQQKLREKERDQELQKRRQQARATYPKRVRIVRSLLKEMQSAGLVTIKEQKRKSQWFPEHEIVRFDVTLTLIKRSHSWITIRNYFSVNVEFEFDYVSVSYGSMYDDECGVKVYTNKPEWVKELKGLLRKAYDKPAIEGRSPEPQLP